MSSENTKNNCCKICGSKAEKIFDAKVLGKYSVDYMKCHKCGFIQTEKPYWLEQAYSAAITAIDVGLIYRNLGLSIALPQILDLLPTASEESYLDYGGGYGILVRIMRDNGYNFFLYDAYADNLFAKHFELKDYSSKQKFTAVTAFEVFEHLENPSDNLQEMLNYSDTIIFSTELQSRKDYSSAADWWYFAPETGQHLSFFTRESIELLGDKFNLSYHSNGTNMHILTKYNLKRNPFEFQMKQLSFFRKLVLKFNKQPAGEKQNGRKSLLQTDFELYKQKYLDELNKL